MLVQFPDRRDGLDHEFAAERVERLRSVKLYNADLADNLEDDILVLVGRHGFLGLRWFQVISMEYRGLLLHFRRRRTAESCV